MVGMINKKLGILFLILLFIFPQESNCQPLAKPIRAKHGMVVSVSAPASDIGLTILKKGGSSVDAAVAVAFALAVTYPEAGNIGGGGFMVVHPPKAKPAVIDYRETAPAAAAKNMYPKGADRYGHKVIGTPGTVRGLALAHEKFGKLPWKTLVIPSVRLAEGGFILDKHVAGSLNQILSKTKENAEFQRVFANKQGSPWKEGDRLVQPDLAKTLRLIAEKGPDEFYQGSISGQIVAEMKSGGGLITKQDLANYHAEVRKPIHGTYRGYDVYGAPPPSSGGVCLVEMLNVLENANLKKLGRYSPQTYHLMIETMRRAYCDRARYLGDPKFTTIPKHLLTKQYAQKLFRDINSKKATPSVTLAPNIPIAEEGTNTTHFSIIDKDGMAVSNTYTLERRYGSRVVVKGAGFLLNNEMLDFNWHPGYTDRKGFIGTKPNLIAPGKKMLSSQSPTIVAKDGKVFLVTGSPGGRTIINTVLCMVVNTIDFQMNVRQAVEAPRFHHQWFPDKAYLEKKGATETLVKQLKSMGHQIQLLPSQGDAHSIRVDPKTGFYFGAADKRRSGKLSAY